MTVLETIQALWAQTQALTALVPGDQVLIGPPVPGTPLPAVALERVAIRKGDRLSAGSLAACEVTLVAEAEAAETLEAILDAVLLHLQTWSAGRYQALAIGDWSSQLGRDPESASEHWTLELTINYFCQRT